MRWRIRASAAALVIASAALGGCETGFDEQLSPVLVVNEMTTDVIVRVWPVLGDGPWEPPTYRIPAKGGGFLAEELGYFEGEVLDDGCFNLGAVESLTTYANTAFMRVTIDEVATVAVEPVLVTANVDQSQWPQLAPTLDCPEPNP